MKKYFITALLALIVFSANAQEKKVSWINNVKLSGYGITEYQYSGQDGAKSNSFNLRLARISLDGRILQDFYWKAQIQFNGNTSTLGSSPKVVDLFSEWQKFDFFRIKIGQFKNPFTFENPMHPIDQGFIGYGQVVQKLAGFSDRAGGHSSNGRDIGLQFQGDFLKNAKGRNLLHYQIGVFNGQGINVKDVDEQKNIIGGVWVMPVAGMRLGAFGWTGSYARKGTWSDEADGATHTGIRKLQQRRYAFSAEYVADDWTFRSEYAHSTGLAFAKALNNTDDATSTNCNLAPMVIRHKVFMHLSLLLSLRTNSMQKPVMTCFSLLVMPASKRQSMKQVWIMNSTIISRLAASMRSSMTTVLPNIIII
jgi:hypothetical protein